MDLKKIIFATGNEGKLREIRMMLDDLGVCVQSMKEAGITVDIEENGTTFEENALIKARAVAGVSGAVAMADDSGLTNQIVLADDSGLEVDALNKEPGVYSARYMGYDTSYHLKNQNLIERLEGKRGIERSARFVCVIAAAFPDGRVITTRGTMEGEIGYEERGANGFGYDPIFYLPDYQCYSAELSLEQKNQLSHRGKALRLMKEELKKLREA